MASDDVIVRDIYGDTASVAATRDLDPRDIEHDVVVPVVSLYVEESGILSTPTTAAVLHLDASAARELGNALLNAAATISEDLR